MQTNQEYEKRTYTTQHINDYDAHTVLHELYKHQLSFLSMKDMFLSTGIFQFESFFMTEEEQTKYIHASLHNLRVGYDTLTNQLCISHH